MRDDEVLDAKAVKTMYKNIVQNQINLTEVERKLLTLPGESVLNLPTITERRNEYRRLVTVYESV
jgi:hypothetical protein